MTGGLFFKPSKHTRVIISFKKNNFPSFFPFRVIARNPPSGGDEAIPLESLRPPQTQGLRDDTSLYFSDLRKFGWLKIFTQTELIQAQKNLGIDILSPDFTKKYFYNQLQKSKRPIKILLLDQTKFAGIGNIYACDSLFLSKINPLTPAQNISLSKSNTLCSNLQKIMSESILHGGSTARDRGYLLPDGNSGKHQDHFLVYQRENEKCLVCKAKIKRIKQGGRSTFYCPHCQK
jgi:formamidopyrimidine-DNA glycosylase